MRGRAARCVRITRATPRVFFPCPNAAPRAHARDRSRLPPHNASAAPTTDRGFAARAPDDPPRLRAIRRRHRCAIHQARARGDVRRRAARAADCPCAPAHRLRSPTTLTSPRCRSTRAPWHAQRGRIDYVLAGKTARRRARLHDRVARASACAISWIAEPRFTRTAVAIAPRPTTSGRGGREQRSAQGAHAHLALFITKGKMSVLLWLLVL